MSDGMNSLLRRAGNRSRALPNIGQTPLSSTPAVQVANAAQAMQGPQPAPMGQMPGMQQSQGPGPLPPPATPNPMAAPRVQPATFTIHPPGTPSDPTHYNYEPQPDGAWRVYPPGVAAPPHALQASMPKAASSADYARMRQAFEQGFPR